MVNKIFADTSFFIALINEKDQYHQSAQNLTERYLRHYLITTDAVLFEIGNALAKTHKKETIEIVKLCETLQKQRLLILQVNYLIKV